MADRIEVVSWSVPGGSKVGVFDHTFLLFTFNVGTPQQSQMYISGTMGGGGNSLSRPFGNLTVNHGDFKAGAYDWGKVYTGAQTIYTGDQAEALYIEMKNNALYIDSLNPRYSPAYINSNALIHTIVKNSLLPDSNDLEARRLIPAGDVDLDGAFGFETAGTAPPGAPVATPLSFYNGFFSGGGGGFDRGGGLGGNGLGGAAGGWSFGGTSGRWVLVGVGVGDGPIDYGYKWVQAEATRIKPVILDLDNDGLELSSAENAPGFAFFGGVARKTMGWFHGGDAMLVHDGNGNGLVDNGSEFSFLHHSPGAQSDLEALRVFDTNANGWLDPGDAAYSQFRLWRDVDFDGVGDPGELVSLASLDVQSISLYGSGGGYQVNGNDVTAQTTFTRVSGGQGTAFDVGLKAFSTGFAIAAQDSNWALAETDSAERVLIMKGDWQAYIPNLRDYQALGQQPNGFQLGAANDDVRIDANGSNRALWISGGDGHDIINLATSSHHNVVIGGSGNDTITGGSGDDTIAPGTGNNTIIDSSGNDNYFFEPGSDTVLFDDSGIDAGFFSGFAVADFQFSHVANSIILYGPGFAVTIKNMWSNPNAGLEYAFFSDRTLSRDQIYELALQGGDAPVLDPGNDVPSGLAPSASEYLL